MTVNSNVYYNRSNYTLMHESNITAIYKTVLKTKLTHESNFYWLGVIQEKDQS